MKNHLGETFKPASHIYSLPLKKKKKNTCSVHKPHPTGGQTGASMATVKISKWPRSVSVFDLQFFFFFRCFFFQHFVICCGEEDDLRVTSESTKHSCVN